ncbi:RpoH suppressor [Sinorhizobium medicae]|uniref:RpoH suppressor SuhR n=1 Tax=Sinorhizobium medicae TaxID=110321 RepID=UPI000FD794F7|nr:RpoH suppressor SuhR [Sinorhizobium medicae]MDX0600457.1 RpoH suppressor [Sinorhizobium medicae]MDX0816690.1 RpoH suppressor [Sinorhizobium medicae]MDX0861508.1 RpoH suppressor [Sinorhizobium medicae]RVJ29722.1 RpoH suppressor [Sinorhizobium medicae]
MARTPAKYCDLVMKGGITSGIVYPNAVLALARDYRFKNIGGTSAGAIAAAACSAAAVGDRCKRLKVPVAQPEEFIGFEGLARASANLSSPGFIRSLLQPAAGAGQAFRLLVILAGSAGFLRKTLALLGSVLRIAPVEMLLLFASLASLAYAVGGPTGILSAALPAVICAYVGGAVFAVLRIARLMRRNLMGLCTGKAFHDRSRGRNAALTDWLHETLQALSGKPLDQPLTFGDLWTAPRYPGEPGSERAVTLKMITTGISHQEPRSLPFESALFWFRRRDFDMLFPKAVVDWMVEKARDPVTVAGENYYLLPHDADMPVLVATRMSLSFPLLISAVPLYEPARPESPPAAEGEARAGPDDIEEKTVLDSTEALTTGGRKRRAGPAAFRICWFSDGGISSNFPIHLFDRALPRWPTFAINLVYPTTSDTRPQPAVFLPESNRQGWQRHYQAIARNSAVHELCAFVFGIVATMQNWRDLLQSRAPGHRERIVHVALSPEEGGLNLAMTKQVLDAVSKKGTAAGEIFARFSFENHYWIRWRNLASALQRYTIDIAASDAYQPKIPDYEVAYALARDATATPPSYRFANKAERHEAARLFEQLISEGKIWSEEGPDLTKTAPRPLPQLQIAPTY